METALLVKWICYSMYQSPIGDEGNIEGNLSGRTPKPGTWVGKRMETNDYLRMERRLPNAVT